MPSPPDEQIGMLSIRLTTHESHPPVNRWQGEDIDSTRHVATTVVWLVPTQAQTTRDDCEASRGRGIQIAATQPAVQFHVYRQGEVSRRQETRLALRPGSSSDESLHLSASRPVVEPFTTPISWGVGVGGILYLVGSVWLATALPEQFWLVVPLLVVSLGGGFWVDGWRERRHPRLLENAAHHAPRSHPR